MLLRALLAILLFVPVAPAADAPDSREFFESRVRPIFAQSCLQCHSGDTRLGGLDMSSRAGLLAGGKLGPSIVPGRASESLLIQAVNYQHERLKMPLGQSRLPDSQVADLVDWVQAGAFWPEAPVPPAAKGTAFAITPEQKSFWSLQPVRKPVVPAVGQSAWPRTDIDRFLLAAMAGKGISPAPAASRRTLLRRAYYDLIGLPPSAADIEAFEKDAAPDAFAKVVDRLLASPQYGERWGRHWLDVARYSDDRLESEIDAPYPNAFRYRDWVIRAFNDDMPYDRFVKAQIAGDLLGDDAKYAAGLGFYALRPDTQDDRVDVTGRAFLGLTTGCAQCHNHKFDPIPTTDYYALLGIFESTKEGEFPLVPEAEVKAYKAAKDKVDAKKAEIQKFLHAQATQIAEMFAAQTARYVRAARPLALAKPADPARIAAIAQQGRFDRETLNRWVSYLAAGPKDHPFLQDLADDAKFDPEQFQTAVLAVLQERKDVDQENLIRKAEAKKQGPKARPELAALKPESYYLWRDLFFNDFYGNQFKQEDDGLLYYGPNRGFYESDGTVERFLSGEFKTHLDRLREELAALQAKLPPQYPFLHVIKDADQPKMERVHIGGNAENLGEEVPHRFLTALSDCAPFERGSGRLELAEAIANSANPLTARVMVNRVWHYHFGAGLVRTPSDLGFMGDRPSNPELLDYLAARFVESGWSLKALHREILLSAAYQAASTPIAKNEEIDPENRLLWRANLRRLDAEALRDSLLAASGELDLSAGGPPQPIADSANHRRTVYGFVSRRKLDGTLALFDFPNPNQTIDRRSITITSPQQLFLLNSPFVMERADRLAATAKSGDTAAGIRRLYRDIYGRAPAPAEVRLGAQFLQTGNWTEYAQALLNTNEFVLID